MALKNKSYKVLIICTSNKDRSPALEEYFKGAYPKHEYRSAGVNQYFCQRKKTHYLTHDDIRWCDLILFAEDIHMTCFLRDFGGSVVNNYIDSKKPNLHKKKEEHKIHSHNIGWRVLNCGEYDQGSVGDDYIMKADLIFREAIK